MKKWFAIGTVGEYEDTRPDIEEFETQDELVDWLLKNDEAGREGTDVEAIIFGELVDFKINKSVEVYIGDVKA